MPTPSSPTESVEATISHTSCPPEDDRSIWRIAEMEGTIESPILDAGTTQQPTPPPHDLRRADTTVTSQTDLRNTKNMDIDEETNGPDMLSPISADGDKHDDAEIGAISHPRIPSPSLGYDFSNVRVSIMTSSCSIAKYTNSVLSYYHLHLPPNYDQVANFMAHNNQNGRSMTYRLKLSM